jgi:hypothetical protein
MAITQRGLPQKQLNGTVQATRCDSYGDLITSPLTGYQEASDEGSYFTAVNATSGTGISASIATAYSATASAFVALRNNDSNPDSGAGKRITLDYLKFTTRTAPASATNWFAVIDIDNVQTRFTSGGTVVTPQNPNMQANNTSVALLNVGALTTAALSASARTVGRIQFRTAIPVVGDTYVITFGGIDKPTGGGVINGSNAQLLTYNAPPVILGQNGVVCISVFGAANAVTGWNAEFEFGWVER